MIKIKEVEIPTPKWWQSGLIIIAIIAVVVLLKENPERVLKALENVMEKIL